MKFALLPFLLLGMVLGKMGTAPAGTAAPDFSLDTAGEPRKVTLSEVVGGNPVLLVFWASWCPACREEIPVLNEWYRTWSPRGLKILSVNVEEPPAAVLKFSKQQKIEYPVLLDREGETANRFGLVGLPAAILLAKGGKILYYGFSLPNLERYWEKGELR